MENKSLVINTGLLALLLSLSLWVMALAPMPLYAAELSVIIKEKGTGNPVEAATVVLMETEDYATSSSLGLVEFSDIQTPKRIKIIATGYTTKEFIIEQNKNALVFYIEPMLIEGNGLEVTADRLVEKTSKIKLSSSELVKAAGAAGSPLKAANALPGVTQTEEDSADVYMRGSNNNENLFWVNNAPVGYLYHVGGSFSTIHPRMIEDVNVFLGGFPVQYGDALGGVLDVKLRTPKNDQRYYNFDLSTVASTFFFEGPVGKAGGDSLAIGMRRSYFDLIASPEKLNNLLGEDNPRELLLVPRFHDFQTLYHRKLNKGYLDGYVFQSGDKVAIKQAESTKGDPNLAGEFRIATAFLTTGVTWQQRWNRQWDSNTAFSYAQQQNQTQGGRDASGQTIFANIENESLQLNSALKWRPSVGSQTSFGLFTRYTRSPLDLYAPRAFTQINYDFSIAKQQIYKLKAKPKTGEISPYIQHRQQWTKKLTSQLGLRYSNIGVTGGFRAREFSPRAALEYQLLADTLLLASWGKYTQMPDRLQLVDSLGNPSLMMSKAEHRIIGVEQKINSLYHVKAEIYHKPMQDLVIAIDENSPPNNYANRGTGEAYGFDLYIKRAQRQGKFGWLSLSFAKSTRRNELTNITRNFTGDQPLTFAAVWGQKLSGDWKRWQISSKVRIQSGQPYTAVVGRYQTDPTDPNSPWIPVYGKPNAERLPIFHKVDIRIGREILFNQAKLDLYLELLNLTFSKNVTAYRYGEDYANIDDPIAVPGYPFFPFVGIEMEF